MEAGEGGRVVTSAATERRQDILNLKTARLRRFGSRHGSSQPGFLNRALEHRLVPRDVKGLMVIRFFVQVPPSG